MERSFPKITEEGLDALRQRIGVKIGQTAEPWCHEATRDNIRHYAHGIGDDNPLWCVPEYAKKTKFGDVIALPSFLFTTSRIISGYVGGLPGIHAMWSGSDWHWHKTVNRNDEITTEAWLKDLIVHDTKFAGRAVQQIYHVDFFNQKGELVADADSWCFRTERDHAREKGTKYKELKQKPVRRYTDASVATDISGLATLLRDDVRCSMPPTPGLYVGRDAVLGDWVKDGFESLGRLRAVPTAVNRQPAVAFYLWRNREGAYLPLTIDVLRVTGGAITEIVTFHDDQFPRLELPERLPADGTA